MVLFSLIFVLIMATSVDFPFLFFVSSKVHLKLRTVKYDKFSASCCFSLRPSLLYQYLTYGFSAIYFRWNLRNALNLNLKYQLLNSVLIKLIVWVTFVTREE